MSISLPGNRLFYLSRDNLEPERFELITGAAAAWRHICEEYTFDDHYRDHYYVEGLRPKFHYQSSYQADRRWGTENDTENRVRNLVDSGDVVMLDSNGPPGLLFYIDNKGELICRDTLAFRFNGWTNILREYRNSVTCRDYRQYGGKPRPTQVIRYRSVSANGPQQIARELKNTQAYDTINSKMAGRLLAAGGVYNQNPEMFAQTAQKLGGDAAQGFDQLLNQQTVGSLVALSSIAMLGRASVAGRPGMAELEELKSYVGKVKGEVRLLDNIQVVKMNYIRRDRAELATLRSQFRSARPKFLQSIADNPELKSRFSATSLADIAKGKNPAGWDVHHKLPLDDSGTNAFDNLILIRRKSEHNLFTKAQSTISKDMVPGDSQQVLWPVPKGIVYP